MQPGGGVLLVAVYGGDRIVFIDTATRAVTGSVPVPKPHTMAVRPDGKLAYVASQQPGKFALVVVDLATRAAVREIRLDKPPRDPEFSYDGKALYFTLAGVNAVQVLDPQSDRIVATVPTGASPHIAAYFRGAPLATAVVQGPGELLLFDPETNAPVRTVAVGKQPHWVAASADGKRAYVTNEGSNDLSVVDLTSGQVTTIAVGNAPRKVVVQQSAAKVGGAATVSIANFVFAPGKLTIAAGDTVTWSNDDGAPHGLAYSDGTPGANLLLPGATFARTFGRPGSYDYLCSVHPYMSGKVIVRAP